MAGPLPVHRKKGAALFARLRADGSACFSAESAFPALLSAFGAAQRSGRLSGSAPRLVASGESARREMKKDAASNANRI